MMLVDHEVGVEGAPARISTLPPAHERRVERRLPIELDVSVEGAGFRLDTSTTDLSPGGMFVATHEALPIGTEVLLGVALPGGVTLELLGTVQWRRGNLDIASAQGVGVSFFCLDPEVKSTIERFCALREPLYYEDYEDALAH
jgi:uncharacterized protein (TIGR02266 family)